MITVQTFGRMLGFLSNWRQFMPVRKLRAYRQKNPDEQYGPHACCKTHNRLIHCSLI
jgi:hypothetical protein